MLTGVQPPAGPPAGIRKSHGSAAARNPQGKLTYGDSGISIPYGKTIPRRQQ